MVLGTGEMQRIWRFQFSAGSKLRSPQINRFGQIERLELQEDFPIKLFQESLAATKRPNEAFTFHQR